MRSLLSTRLDPPRGPERDHRVPASAAFAMAGLLALALLAPTAAHATPPGPGSDDEPAPEGQRQRGPSGFTFGQPDGWIGIKGGWLMARADSDIFEFNAENLTLSEDDFDAPLFGVEVGWVVNDRLDAVFGLEYAQTSPRSEFRDFVDAFGAPITQETRLKQVPLTASLRLYLTDRGRRVGNYAWVPSTVAPYVGGGAGLLWWEYEQFGDFVDFFNLTIFTEHFATDGVTATAHAFGGAAISLSPRVSLDVEARYSWADGELAPAFVGFEPIDLAGLRTTAGVSFRF